MGQLRTRAEALYGRLNREDGIALIMAAGFLAVLSVSVTSATYYASTNSGSASRSKADQAAFALAEAGMNTAVSILNGANTQAMSQSALPSACCTSTMHYDTGDSYWWGVLDGSSWTIYGRGVVRNPTGVDAAPVTRQVNSSVQVKASQIQPYNATAWDYVMSTAVAGGNTCDQTIADGTNTGQPAVIQTRLYTFGNLCIGSVDGGRGTITAAPLHVRGKVFINESTSGIGTAALSVAGAHIGSGCSYLGRTLHSPCGTVDHIYSNPAADAYPDLTVVAPVADFGAWYSNASPGPKSPCTAVSGTPPVLDNDTLFNNSVPAVFELTPATDYTCQTANGELSWKASTKTLTVSGTIFIDGSAKITNGALNQYAGPASNAGLGQATLYLSGTFMMSSGSKLCGSISGSDCDWLNWNPSAEIFGIIAQGTGGQDPAGVSIHMKGAEFQGGLYGVGKIRPEGTTQTQGPMIASEVELGYNVNTTNQIAKGFPLISTLPLGFPGVLNTYALPMAPTDFSG